MRLHSSVNKMDSYICNPSQLAACLCSTCLQFRAHLLLSHGFVVSKHLDHTFCRFRVQAFLPAEREMGRSVLIQDEDSYMHGVMHGDTVIFARPPDVSVSC